MQSMCDVCTLRSLSLTSAFMGVGSITIAYTVSSDYSRITGPPDLREEFARDERLNTAINSLRGHICVNLRYSQRQELSTVDSAIGL